MGISKVHPGCSLLFRVRCARKGAPASWPAGSIERGQRKKNPVVPRGTWRLRISIIAGIKARASFLAFRFLSFLYPGLPFLVLLLKVLFRHIIGTNARVPHGPMRASTATTFASLSCGHNTLSLVRFSSCFSASFCFSAPYPPRPLLPAPSLSVRFLTASINEHLPARNMEL